MLDLRRLHLLRELHSRGTIAATAAALSYSAPAVSQQLAKLEAEAGVKLLERIGRGVRLTDAGLRLVAHTGALLARMEQAEADLVASTGAVRGVLHVTMFQTAAITLLAPALRALASEHPHLRIWTREMEPDAALDALALGEVDVVLADEYPARPHPRDPAIRRATLHVDPLRLVLPARHPLALAERAVALPELAALPWAVGLAGSAYAETVIAACRQAGGFEPDVRHHTTDLMVIRALVAAGQAVTLLPDLLGAHHDPDVAVRPLADAPLERHIFTAVRASALHRPGITELHRALRDVCATLATG